MPVVITDEILKMNDLGGTEKIVLGFYRYYTVEGRYKCCCMTNSQIAEYLNISIYNLRKIKAHLKQLGYIRTDGGIKVTYTGEGVIL